MFINDDSGVPEMSELDVEYAAEAFQMTGKGIEGQLLNLSIEGFSRRMAATTRGAVIEAEMFIVPRWHRPYAEALMAPDPRTRQERIAQAEHAIFERYLEMCAAAPAAAEYESSDLNAAVRVLARLKNPEKML
jgi:hypothetical protein